MIQLRFYEELNDFLSPALRKTTFEHELNRQASVKDVIESFGVPHTEVDVILVDGESVGFDYRVRDGDRISVYPVFERLDITPLLRLRARPLRNPAFIADANLGRLAKYLRLLGFDCLYDNRIDDDELARISSEAPRILLTRDRVLLRRRIITHGCYVHAVRPREQVREVLDRLDLYRMIRPFTRCTRCNGTLATVDKAEVLDRLQPLTRKYYDEFLQCAGCGQVYWKGSHHKRALDLIEVLGAIQGTTSNSEAR